MHDRINVAVIHADGDRAGSCRTVALWAGSRIWARRGFMLDLIEPPDPRTGAEDEVRPAPWQRLARADAAVIVTPENEHGPTVSLRHLIEHAQAEWQEKPVAFISHGSGSGQAVEGLRAALESLKAVVLDGGIRLNGADGRFDADGELPVSDPAHEALDALLTRLHREAVRLRDRRAGSQRRVQPASAEAD